jgi:acyl-CoA reductase-like NAD-dependent aldehyde dehydrogenase
LPTFQRLYIGGDWVAPDSTQFLDVTSPSTEESVGSAPSASRADLDRAVTAARAAFDTGPWPHLSPADRAQHLRRLADGLRAHGSRLSTVITDEAGLPTMMSTADSSIGLLTYYADFIERYDFAELRGGEYADVVVRSEPVGVVAAILPWNSPLAIAFMKLAPALAAGCTVVLKVDPLTPLHAFVLGEVLEEIGLPPGVVNILPAEREVSEALVAHPGIDKVSFTGSTATGARVAEICARDLRRYSLELGGKSAAIVLEDADLPTVIPGLVGAACLNNGEACVLQSRVLAPRSRYDEVVDALSDAIAAMPVGDPHDPKTAFGPLISEQHRDRVEGYIASGISEGAQAVLGGGRPQGLSRGWYVEPTVLRNVDNRMRVAQEEIFGPVVSVIPYDTENDAVTIANDTPYGLSGTVWTADFAHGMEIAARIRAGNYGVNTFGMESCAPFGGFKSSGVGRENGPEGFAQFIEKKAVHVPKGTRVNSNGSTS